MPHFYFHLLDGVFISDNKGTACETRKDAQAFAANVAAEYGRNRDRIDDDLCVSVTDEMGKEVFRTPVANHASKVAADTMVATLRSERRQK